MQQITKNIYIKKYNNNKKKNSEKKFNNIVDSSNNLYNNNNMEYIIIDTKKVDHSLLNYVHKNLFNSLSLFNM